MEQQILYRFNEWWLNGIVRPELTGKFERENYKEIKERMQDRQILLLYGLRRVKIGSGNGCDSSSLWTVNIILCSRIKRLLSGNSLTNIANKTAS